MSKIFIATFVYDSGMSVENKATIIRADSKEEAENIFNNKIKNIFNYSMDICTLTSVIEVSDEVDLIYIQGGLCWVE